MIRRAPPAMVITFERDCDEKYFFIILYCSFIRIRTHNIYTYYYVNVYIYICVHYTDDAAAVDNRRINCSNITRESSAKVKLFIRELNLAAEK